MSPPDPGAHEAGRESAQQNVGGVPDEEDCGHGGEHEPAQPTSEFLELGGAGLDFQIALTADGFRANGKICLGHLDLTLLTE